MPERACSRVAGRRVQRVRTVYLGGRQCVRITGTQTDADRHSKRGVGLALEAEQTGREPESGATALAHPRSPASMMHSIASPCSPIIPSAAPHVPPCNALRHVSVGARPNSQRVSPRDRSALRPQRPQASHQLRQGSGLPCQCHRPRCPRRPARPARPAALCAQKKNKLQSLFRWCAESPWAMGRAS